MSFPKGLLRFKDENLEGVELKAQTLKDEGNVHKGCLNFLILLEALAELLFVCAELLPVNVTLIG